MKAIVYHGPEDFRYEDAPDPELKGPQDVILEIERTAICGSDLHLWHGFPEGAGLPAIEPGFSVGHEFLGTVVEVGDAVQNFRRGDRVLAACTTGCGTCDACRVGLYSACPVTTQGGTVLNVFGFGSALPGGQAEAARVPFADTNCIRLPAGLSDEACLFLTDILPTGYMGADLAEVGPGDTVLVYGCGPVGTFAQMSAKIRGAARVIAVDLDAGRLRRAADRGCLTINPEEVSTVERVLELTGGRGADATIEAIGVPALVNEALLATRPGGRIAVIGVISEPVEVAWPLVFNKNLRLESGLVNPQRYIPALLPLIEQELLDPAQIISHRLSLAEGPEGYEIFAGHRDNVLKVVLEP